MENISSNEKISGHVTKSGIRMANKNCSAEIEYTIYPNYQFHSKNNNNMVLIWKVAFQLKNIIYDDGTKHTMKELCNFATLDFEIDPRPHTIQGFREINDFEIEIVDIKAEEYLQGTGIGTVFWELMMCDIMQMYLKATNLDTYPNIFIKGSLSNKDYNETSNTINSQSGSSVRKKGGWNSSLPFYLKIGRKTLGMNTKSGFLYARTTFVKTDTNNPNTGKEILYNNCCEIDSCELTDTEIESCCSKLIPEIISPSANGKVYFRFYH